MKLKPPTILWTTAVAPNEEAELRLVGEDGSLDLESYQAGEKLVVFVADRQVTITADGIIRVGGSTEVNSITTEGTVTTWGTYDESELDTCTSALSDEATARRNADTALHDNLRNEVYRATIEDASIRYDCDSLVHREPDPETSNTYYRPIS
jgi:hypothetical protein